MFSETVDEVIARSGRNNKLLDIISYTNTTIRKIHVHKDWFRDVKYLKIIPAQQLHGYSTATTAQVLQQLHAQQQLQNALDGVSQGFLRDYETLHRSHRHHTQSYAWQLPKLFKKIHATRYDECCPAVQIMPSAVRNDELAYYYLQNSTLKFFGFSHSIELWYSTFAPTFAYYERNKRPAVYNRATETWQYFTPLQEPEELKQKLVSNWLLEEWQECVVVGALYALYSATGDERAAAMKNLFAEELDAMRRSVAEQTQGYM